MEKRGDDQKSKGEKEGLVVGPWSLVLILGAAFERRVTWAKKF